MNTQIWKLAWSPQGYPPIEFTLDTSNNKLGDVLSLPHTFFMSSGLSFQLENGSVLTIGIAGTDILLINQDSGLSELAGSAIYRNIRLNSEKSLGIIKGKCTFIADILDPEDFGQSLTPTSDVTHKSISTENITSEKGSITSLSTDKIALGSSSLTQDTLLLSKMILSSSGIHFDTEDSISFGNIENYIKYDTNNKCWVKKNTGTGEDVPLISFYSKDNTENSIPFTTDADTSSLMTASWFTLNYNNQSLNIPQIITESIITNNIKIGQHTIAVVNSLISIDDFLSFDKDTGTITMGSLILTVELQNKLLQLLSK